MESLFSLGQRVDFQPSSQSESKYRYLDQSARIPFSRIRAILEEWFERYPQDHKPTFLVRFKSDREEEHLGAFLELYCHELLIRHGYEVDVHPLSEHRRTPDFRVHHAGQTLFFVEATIAWGDGAKDNQLSRILDRVNELNLPGFFVNVLVLRTAANAPSASGLIREIKRVASMHDPDELIKERFSPRFGFEDRGWLFELGLIPKKIEARGKKNSRTLGIISGAARPARTNECIERSLRKKATYYTSLGAPFIIAIACMDGFVAPEDYGEALFGDAWAESRVILDPHVTPTRKRGLWFGPSGFQNTKVSAVLGLGALFPWTIAAESGFLWHNPRAMHPVSSQLWNSEQIVVQPETYEVLRIAGAQASEILGIPFDLLKNDPRPIQDNLSPPISG